MIPRPGRHRLRVTGLGAAVALATLSSACTVENGSGDGDSASGASSRSLEVSSSDSACEVSAARAPAGTLTFAVRNTGSEITEFYLLDETGKRVVGEVENIGPGLTRNLVVSAPEGRYVTACKPGMKGEGIRADFVVTASASSSEDAEEVGDVDDALVEGALTEYQRYVRDQSRDLLRRTEAFVAAYTAGQDTLARQLYPRAREPWERIEPVAESFGDLDPKMDAREADLEEGQRWTGWHRIEKDLWPPASYDALAVTQRREYADDLLANTRTLDRRIQKLTFSVDQIANGSRGLLEEVAVGKVTGEEETWSHTDLWDFQANVDGARAGVESLRPVLEQRDEELAETLERRFEELQRLLDEHRRGDGFVSYDRLGEAQVKQLSDAVNALSEPLSRVTATVLG